MGIWFSWRNANRWRCKVNRAKRLSCARSSAKPRRRAEDRLAGGTDDPVAWYEGSGVASPRYMFKDERGSVIATEAAGVVSVNRYDEYGAPDAANTGRFQYTGRYWIAAAYMFG